MRLLALVLVITTIGVSTLQAIPETMHFQGLLADEFGSPVPDGQHSVIVSIYNQPVNPGTLLWQNTRNVTTADGVFDVILGEVAPISLDFDQQYYLGIAVDGGAEMTPRIQLTSSPYAFRAKSVDDGAAVRSLNGLADDVILVAGSGVTIAPNGNTLIISATGGGGGDDGDWADVGAGNIARETGNVFIGSTTGIGPERLYVTNTGSPTKVRIQNATESSITVGAGPTAGELKATNEIVSLSSTFTGSHLSLEAQGEVRLDGSDDIVLYRSSTVFGRFLGNAVLELMDGGITTASFGATGTGGSHGGQMILQRVDRIATVELNALDDTAGDAGSMTMRNGDDVVTVKLDAQQARGGQQGSRLRLYNGVGTNTVEVDTDRNNGQGALTLRSSAGTATVLMDAHGFGGIGRGGALNLYDGDGDLTVNIDGDNADSGSLAMRTDAQGNAVLIEAQEGGVTGQGASVKLYNYAGTQTIELDADHGGTGQGRIITEVIEITGGADLSERFDVTGDDVEPGMVVSIDPAEPGALSVSSTPYDRRVAGIVSGAGGVRPGMLMGQRGSTADGEHPVALSGRVYCLADASNGPIEPGDLLTTSERPGYAMKVTDYPRAQGAILGKAMTSLDTGTGNVLVLVGLQ